MSSRENPWVVLGVLTFNTALTSYVEAMVIPSLPHIQSALSATNEEAAWVVSAYMVVGASIAPLFGKLGDNYGKKRLYLLSLIFYSVAVLMAGFAPNIGSLITARAVQGFGFAIFPLSIAIVTDVFPRERVALAQGVISAMVAIGMTIGMIAGAYIEEYLGWRFMFHIAFVLSLLALALSAALIGPHPPVRRTHIDYGSTLLVATAVMLILVYLTETPYIGWFSPLQLALLVSGLALFGGFVAYELHAYEPLISPHLLVNRNVMVANLSGLLSGIAMFILYLGVIYYAEEPPPYGLGLSVIQAALSLFPATVAMIVIAPIVGYATSSLGPRPVLIYGSLVAALGFWLFTFARANVFQLVMDSFITGVGIVSIITPIVNMVAVSMPSDSVAVGLGFNTMVRYLGAAAGPVISATILTTYKSYALYYVPGFSSSLLSGAFLEPGPHAFNLIFLVGMAFSLATALVSAFANNYRWGRAVLAA